MLSSELSRLAKTNARSNALRVMEIDRSNDLENSKRNRVDQWIKHHVILMLLNSMSTDGETAATEPTDELKEVLNSEYVGQAGKTPVALSN